MARRVQAHGRRSIPKYTPRLPAGTRSCLLPSPVPVLVSRAGPTRRSRAVRAQIPASIENPNTSLPALPPMPTSPIAVGTSTSSDPFLDSSPLTGRPRSVVRRKSVNYNTNNSSNPNSSSELVAPLPVSSTSVNSTTPVLAGATRRVRTEAGLSMDSSNSASASDSNSSGDHHPVSALPSMPEDINVPSDFTPQPTNRNSYPYGGGYASNTYPMSNSNSQSNVAQGRTSLPLLPIHPLLQPEPKPRRRAFTFPQLRILFFPLQRVWCGETEGRASFTSCESRSGDRFTGTVGSEGV